MQEINEASVRRWRIARRLVLGTILIGGVMTAAAAAMTLTPHRCGGHHAAGDGAYVYSGVGVEIEERGDQFVVRTVFAGSPADGKIHPGAVLVKADGQRPRTVQGWSRLIRGDEGTLVELEVAYPCGGHETVDLERRTIRVRR